MKKKANVPWQNPLGIINNHHIPRTIRISYTINEMLNHCMHRMWYNNAKLWEINKYGYASIMQYDKIGDLFRIETYHYNLPASKNVLIKDDIETSVNKQLLKL